jgi:16S rRNA processing protein RimM
LSSEWKLIGKVKEAHGLRGELYIILFAKDYSWLDSLKEFSLAMDEKSAGQRVFSAVSMRAQKNRLILKSSEILDRTMAEKLLGNLFFIRAELLSSKPGERIFLSEIANFEVSNGANLIGKITSFSSNGPQDILILTAVDGATFEIPFVEAFIQDIDFQAQKITMQLPEGLLEINQSSRGEKK